MRQTLLQAEIDPELARRFAKLRERLGMSAKTLLTRVLIEALPRWEDMPEPTPTKDLK